MTKRRPSPDEANEPVQRSLFGPVERDPSDEFHVEPHPCEEGLLALAAALPEPLRMGTSSWAFAGWRGLVYAEGTAQKRLSRGGLRAYARHPLFTAVGVDRTYYAPIAAADFADYAAAVPPQFRFLVKAWGDLTAPYVRGRSGKNPRYLDHDLAIDRVLAPAVEGLDERLGPLLFQFPPQGRGRTNRPEAFADDLHEFLARLPRGAHYAVELRDEALFTERYTAALAAAGAHHCYSAHPRMPSVSKQAEIAPIEGPITIRWMLHGGLDFQGAKGRYEPFDRLVDPDPVTRTEIAQLCIDALAREVGVVVVINNKAEGSAPRSVRALAEAIAETLRASET